MVFVFCGAALKIFWYSLRRVFWYMHCAKQNQLSPIPHQTEQFLLISITFFILQMHSTLETVEDMIRKK